MSEELGSVNAVDIPLPCLSPKTSMGRAKELKSVSY